MTLHETLREEASSPSAAPPPMMPTPVPGTGWRNRMARVFAGRTATELVETQSLFTVSQPEAWRRIVFYEEAPAPLRWPLRAVLPQPLGVRGEKNGAGALVQCVYRGGSLMKQVTVMAPPRTLCFRVLDQNLGIEDGVRALDGYYELAPQLEGCSVTLATHYESRMHPRWLWRPLEKYFLTQLHRHILASMQTQNERTCERQESRT
ncbi:MULTISPECIES: hypothetical protein [Acidobacterium]|nr:MULTISPECIES: hypothetical protein [Acidobacterium]HCT62162.1 hypothetical protein [Acidobacterium sp.]